jgi:hypothetical protein
VIDGMLTWIQKPSEDDCDKAACSSGKSFVSSQVCDIFQNFPHGYDTSIYMITYTFLHTEEHMQWHFAGIGLVQPKISPLNLNNHP